MTDKKVKFIGENPNRFVAELVVAGLQEKNQPFSHEKEFTLSLDNPKIPNQEALDLINDLLLKTGLFEEVSNTPRVIKTYSDDEED